MAAKDTAIIANDIEDLVTIFKKELDFFENGNLNLDPYDKDFLLVHAHHSSWPVDRARFPKEDAAPLQDLVSLRGLRQYSRWQDR